MRRTLLLILALLTTGGASAQQYIVPAYARGVSNGATTWFSEMLLTNPHAHAVELQLEQTFGDVEPNGCRFPEFSLGFPEHLAPGESRLVCMPFASAGAFAFQSTAPIVVASEMVAVRGSAVTRQTIEPGREWIEQDATIDHVRIGDGARANLIALNPGEVELTLRYELVRKGSSPPANHDYASVEGFITVPPRGMSITPLPEGPRFDCMRLVPCGNAIEHRIELSGDSRFYAATSSVEGDDATFRSPFIRE